jgi:N-carbamoyl-L-amino-acid hydrolase
MAGLLEAGDLSARDEEGRTLADHLPAVGGDAAQLQDGAKSRKRVAGYFELHIEQGPILFEESVQIGIVTGITGRAAATVTVQGFANHAGTTPMHRRQDAGAAGARIALAVRDIAARERLCRVGTVGIAHLRPGAINVIPGACTLEVEFRDLRDDAVEAALRRLVEQAATIAAEERVQVEVTVADRESGTPTDPRFRDFLARAADGLGHSRMDLESGASHDAQSMAHLGPVGMVFVPSVHGVSHAVSECTPPEDCVRGAEVLLEALLLADAELA